MSKRICQDYPGLCGTELLPTRVLSTFKVPKQLEAIILGNSLPNGIIVSQNDPYYRVKIPFDSNSSDRIATVSYEIKNHKGETISKEIVSNIHLTHIVEVKTYKKRNFYAYYITPQHQILVLEFGYMPFNALVHLMPKSGHKIETSFRLAYINGARTVPTIPLNSLTATSIKWYEIEEIFNTPGIVSGENVNNLTEFLIISGIFPFTRSRFWNIKQNKYHKIRIRIYDIENVHSVDPAINHEDLILFDQFHRESLSITKTNENRINYSLADDFDGDPDSAQF